MRRFLLPFVVSGLLIFGFSGCGGEGDFVSFEAANRSARGFLAEQALPADTWFTLDFSTTDVNQRVALDRLMERFTQDPEEFERAFLEGLDARLKSIDLSYWEDIRPLLGDSGFRFVWGLSDGDDGKLMPHGVLTVADPDGAATLLANLETSGEFLKVVDGGLPLYFRAVPQKETEVPVSLVGTYYLTLYEDLLLLSSDREELKEMVQSLKSVGASSLATSEGYREVVTRLPEERVLSFYINSATLNAHREAGVAGGALETVAPSLVKYLDGQGFAFTASVRGLEFNGFALGDREALKAAGETLDRVKAKKAYLYKDMPSQDLAAYMESYDLGRALQNSVPLDGALARFGVSSDKLKTGTASLESLLGKGYAVALHQNQGFLPGVTFMLDASDGAFAARTLLDLLDEKVAGFVGLLAFQGGSLGDAIKQETVTVEGELFNAVRLNVEALLDLYRQSGDFSVPSAVEGSDVVLLYGMTKDERVIFSTYDGWLSAPSQFLNDSEDFSMSLSEIKPFRQGIFYLQFDSFLKLAEAFESFRSALRSDATSIYQEFGVEDPTVVATGEAVPVAAEAVPVVEPSVLDWAEVLAPLKNFAFSSKASKYEVRLKGVLLVGE